MDTSAAVLVGSAISAIVAMVVVALQYVLERRRQSIAERAGRLGDFLASSFATAVGIEEIAGASMRNKSGAEAKVRSSIEDRINSCLTRLRLFEDEDVVVAATYLERELTRITSLAREQVWSRAEWREQRSELSRLTREYENIARQKLGRKRLDEKYGFYVVRDTGSCSRPA